MIYEWNSKPTSLKELLDGTPEGRTVHSIMVSKRIQGLWEPIKDPQIAETMMKYADTVPLAAVQTSLMYYLGEMLPRDDDQAMHYARLAADAGYQEGECLLSYYNREPDQDGKKIATEYKGLEEDYPRELEYSLSNVRPHLQDCIEWTVLLRACKTDWYGWADENENEYGGYHNEFFDIRPYREWSGYEEDLVPGSNFEFRPYDLHMNWYKYPWRDPQCNKEMRVQQVLYVFRLCIEIMRDGRNDFPPAGL